MFGGGSAFGAPQQQQQQQPAGMFGKPAPSPFGQQQPQQGSSLFGAPQQGSSLFGAPQQQPQQGASLFGAPQQPQQGSSLFGAPQQQGSSLFGAPQQQQGSSLFGAPQQQQGSSLFGGSSASTFGSSSTSTVGLFGGCQMPASSPFGGGGGLFGQQQPQQQQQQQQQQPSIFPQQPASQQPLSAMDQAVRHAEISGPFWYRELVGVQAAYRLCRYNKFQSLLYETIPQQPAQINNGAAEVKKLKQDRQRVYFANLPWLDEREWQRMEDDNPDPVRWNPAPVIGIDMLEKRAQKQATNAQDQLAQNLDWIESCQQNLQVVRERVDAAKRRYSALHAQLVSSLGRLERLSARQQGSAGPRTPQEVAFTKQLEEVQRRVCHPTSGLFTKVLQLDAKLAALSGGGVEGEAAGGMPAARSGAADEEEDKRNELMLRFLHEQSKALSVVMDVLRRDAKEVKLLKAKLGI